MQADLVRFCDQCGAANRTISKFCSSCGQILVTYSSGVSIGKTGLLIANVMLKQRYKIVHKLGQGGFGAVYLVADTTLDGAPRAIKEMSIQGTGFQPIDPFELKQAVEAFKQEAILLAKLMHHNLPRISDYFEEQGRWYLVMDYIQGETLEKVLEAAPGKKLALPIVLQLATQLCTVLAYLHSRNPPIIFRDIKPGNIMLAEHNHLYLIDFGIARLFKPGQSKDTTALGSQGYAPPEQYGKEQSTPQTDIYSLGVTLHEMLSGRDPSNFPPFQFPPLALDQYAAGPALASLIQRMVAIVQDQRPANMQEVKQEIEKLSQMPTSGKANNPIASSPQVPPLSAKPATASIPVVIVAPVGGDYYTIQDAVKHVAPGTRIIVRPGVYDEGVVLDKHVEIMGDGPREQILLICDHASCLSMKTEKALVSGLTMRGQAEGYYTVDIPQGRLHLRNCLVTSTTGTSIGIYNSTADPLIQQCTICDSTSSGISVHTQGKGTIENCDIFANTAAGVAISTRGNPLIRRCKIYNGLSNGIQVYNNGEGTVEDCNIFMHKLSEVAISTGGNPLIRGCKIHDGSNSGIYILDHGEGTIENCDIFANALAGVGISTGGKPLIRRCKIYKGSSNGIWVFEQGEGTIEDCDIFANKNPGIGISTKGNPLVRRCKIYNGSSNGIWVFEQGEGTIEDCDIFANKSPGIGIATKGNPLVRHCKIHDGPTNGIWVFEQGEGTIEDCDIFANKGVGIAISKGGNPLIRNCKLHDGLSSGIYVYEQGEGTIEDCATFGNKGRGFSTKETSKAVIKNCTFKDGKFYNL